VIILLLAGTIALATTWIVRSCRHIYNYEYISYIEFKHYREKKIEEIRVDDEEVLNSEGFTESKESVYVPMRLNLERRNSLEAHQLQQKLVEDTRVRLP
jgi:hypothetical protein